MYVRELCNTCKISLRCKHGLFMQACVSKNAIVSKFAIFCDPLKQPYTKNILFCDSRICYFQWITQGRWKSEIVKVQIRWLGWEMPLCRWQIFWMVPWSICCFIVLLIYIERKWLFMGYLATALLLKSKLPGKCKRFNAIHGSIKMLKCSWISKTFN